MAHNPPQVSRSRKIRISPATVIAFVALLIALGGAAYAAFKLPKNSVKSKNIVNGQVKAPDLAKNAVQASNLKAGSVAGAALAPDAVDSSKVKDGSLTPNDVANVLARIRGTGDVQTTSTGANYPLSNATWTQAANQPDLAVVNVNYTSPATCGGIGASFNSATIKIDGSFLATVVMAATPASTTQNASALGVVPAPTSATSHGLTATVAHGCSGASEAFTVHSIDVDIVGFG
jgi:hypothetical protein